MPSIELCSVNLWDGSAVITCLTFRFVRGDLPGDVYSMSRAAFQAGREGVHTCILLCATMYCTGPCYILPPPSS